MTEHSTPRPDRRPCPFCNAAPSRVLHATPLALALTDSYPVNPGHALIVPRRHVASWFDVDADERREMLVLLDEARATIRRTHNPGGFNIGINDGSAAGQTVPHVHVHLIPRYRGDVSDPRGGVRWVLAERADYWSAKK
jgi:diadenosine tetraphosphate (Ap4A) HIT family hydrolase